MPVVWSAVGATALPFAGSLAGNLVTKSNLKWYETLNRPSWRPPNWVFGPVWTYLYASMGYASYLVWRDGGGFEGPAKIPLILYSSQLALNWTWSHVFFGAHNLPLSVVNIGVLWANVAACGYFFYHINNTAGLLFVPYMAWLTLASCLNYNIYKNNPSSKVNIKEVKDE